MSESDGRISVQRDGHVGVLTLDRPDRMNALTLEMIHDLRAHAADLDADPEVFVIALRAEGERAFCVGGDLRAALPPTLEARRDIMNPDPRTRFFSDVYTPIVVGIQGLCLGGGFEIMLGTDLRLAADDATFGLPEVGLGLIPGSGTNVRLTRQLPWALAMELLLGGGQIDADRALAMGLVNEVVARAMLGDRLLERAHQLASNGPFAMRAAKEIAVRSWGLEGAFELEYAVNSRVITSRDAAEGVAAFQEKRAPRFGNG